MHVCQIASTLCYLYYIQVNIYSGININTNNNNQNQEYDYHQLVWDYKFCTEYLMQTSPAKEGKWVVSNSSTTLLPPRTCLCTECVRRYSVNDVSKCFEIVLLELR